MNKAYKINVLAVALCFLSGSVKAAANVPGRWIWSDNNISPNAGTAEYEAIFLPDDLENYNPITTMVTVNTLPAIPIISNANAEIKAGRNLSDVTNVIEYSAKGINEEKIQGSFSLKDEDRKLTALSTGDYTFIFHPQNSNYKDTDVDVAIKVTSNSSSGGSRPSSGSTYNYPSGLYIPTNTDAPEIITSNAPTPQPYIYGYEDGTFRPDNPITRAEIAAILSRIREHENNKSKMTFDDVEESAWYAQDVLNTANSKLLIGYSDNTFRPDKPITRAEIAVVGVRFLGLDTSVSSIYGDCIGHWADVYIAALTTKGIINGYKDGTFKPDNPVTRSESVKIINGIIGLNASSHIDNSKKYTDLDKSHWAYRDIMVATPQNNIED